MRCVILEQNPRSKRNRYVFATLLFGNPCLDASASSPVRPSERRLTQLTLTQEGGGFGNGNRCS